MQNLLSFLYRNRFFFAFLLLEGLALFLVVRNNSFHSASFFSSSNKLAGTISGYRSETIGYLSLNEQNQTLAQENALLREELFNLKSSYQRIDFPDSGQIKYKFIQAKVVNNSFLHPNNYFTIDKGLSNGVKRGMGVVSAAGVAGVVKLCSENFATVVSQLNTSLNISAKFKKNGVMGTMKWQGNSPILSTMYFVPRHQPVFEGDTIVTTGYSAAFPEDIMIGTVKRVNSKPESSFYEITVRLSTDFTRLNYVYVADNFFKAEKDSLEVGLKAFMNE